MAYKYDVEAYLTRMLLTGMIEYLMSSVQPASFQTFVNLKGVATEAPSTTATHYHWERMCGAKISLRYENDTPIQLFTVNT